MGTELPTSMTALRAEEGCGKRVQLKLGCFCCGVCEKGSVGPSDFGHNALNVLTLDVLV